jgi:hypothetical protein
MTFASVLVIAHSRPNLLKNILSNPNLQKRKVYIHIDGSRNNLETLRVEECKRLAVEYQEQNLGTYTFFQTENLGTKLAPLYAIDWAFENEEELIIIEDDVVVTDGFFEFCEWGLNTFKENIEVLQINGWTPIDFPQDDDAPYVCLYSHIWGWATWRNRWQFHDRNFELWHLKSIANNADIADWDEIDNFSDYWNAQVIEVLEGKQTWDVAWFISSLTFGLYSISPSRRLTGNSGFGDIATHTQNVTDPIHTKLPSHSTKQRISTFSMHLDLSKTAYHNRLAFKIKPPALSTHSRSAITLDRYLEKYKKFIPIIIKKKIKLHFVKIRTKFRSLIEGEKFHRIKKYFPIILKRCIKRLLANVRLIEE